MRCDDVRGTLSAWLDGEASPVDAAALPAHLDSCAECRRWLGTAERITRFVRTSAPEAPDLTARILAAVQAEERDLRWRPRLILRWLLGLLAGVQLLVAVPALVIGSNHEVHSGRELAAFDIALAVGFLVTARFPERAGVFVPVAAVLSVCLLLGSGLDVAGGVVAIAHETVHLLAVAQAALLWILSRESAGGQPETNKGRSPLAV